MGVWSSINVIKHFLWVRVESQERPHMSLWIRVKDFDSLYGDGGMKYGDISQVHMKLNRLFIKK